MCPSTFHRNNYRGICRSLAASEPVFARALERDGYPPLWRRPPGFATLVRIILEQQVSLAAAASAYRRLLERIGAITPDSIASLSDQELRAVGFSRQKARYARELAAAVLAGGIELERLPKLSDAQAAAALTAMLGIGRWSAEVYLMMCLQRRDVFPLGDVALCNSMRHEFGLDPLTPVEELAAIAGPWQPDRSVAAFILWHAYILRRNIRVPYEMH